MEMGRSQLKETRVVDWEGTGYDTSTCKEPKREYDTGLQNFKWMDKTLSSPLGMRGHSKKTVCPDSK